SWLVIDENDYPVAKMKRLVDTGGAIEPITWGWTTRELRTIYDQATSSVWLFLTMVIIGAALTWLGTIERRRGLAFGISYVVLAIGVPLWMSAYYRFPQRVSLSFYTVAALGVFVYLARQVADAAVVPDLRPTRDRRAAAALAVIAVFALGWARNLIT